MKKLALLEAILDKTNLICYAADMETYELIYLNRATKETVGINDDSYIGKKCYKLLQGNEKPCSFCTNHKLKEGCDYRWDHYNSLLNKYFDVMDTTLNFNGRKIRLEYAVDITDKKEELFALKNKLTVEETLVRCVQTLSGDLDVQTAIYRLLSVICDFYKADRAYIFEMHKEKKLLVNTYEWCRSGIAPQIDNLGSVPLNAVDTWVEKFKELGYFYISNLNHDLSKDSLDYKILQPQGIDSLIAAPLKSDEEISGFVGVDNPTQNIKDASLLRSISLFIMDDLKKRKTVSQLEKLSFVDDLTGLFNRHKYMNEITELSSGNGKSVGILYADINGLKAANDDYGHEYGDKLIKEAASLLLRHFSDSVYRVGGDEFVVLSYDSSSEGFEARVKNFRKAHDKQKELYMSFGSVWCADSRDISRHVSYADEIMYVDKQNYYKQSRGESKKYRASIASDLLELINNDNFTVYLQPKVKLSDSSCVGAEALLRKIINGRVIEPHKFMHVYEKTGLISYLDMFVLEKVCKIIRQWTEQGYNLLPISVNFSRYTVMEYNIAEKMLAMCGKYDVDPQSIMIEITEHVSDIKGVALNAVLSDIKRQGFKISLDDFGSEYSSIAILGDIQFDEIKLDKSLMNKVDESSGKEIVKHLISLCNSLKNTDTIVEGIETPQQVEILKKYNCLLGQGYLFSKPVSVKDFTRKFLKRN